MNLSEIEKKIVAAIEKTSRQIEEYREMSLPVEPDCAIGRISRMDAINNKSVTEASLRQAEDRLQKLQIVYDQLGTDEFGLCKKCNAKIPIGRILFRPESMFCVRCAQ